MLASLYIVYSKTINANFVIFVVTITIGWICAIMSSGEEKADSLLYVLEYAFTAWKMFLVRSAPAKKLLKEVFSLGQTRMASDSGIKRIHCDFSRYNFKMFCSLLIVTTITLILFILHAYGSWQLWRVQELQGMEPKRTLIFPEWLPFDKVKMFDVIYFYQIWNASLAAGLIVGTDVVFVSLVSFTSVRLRVLGYKMRNFGRGIEDEFINNSEILRNLILEHKDIIRYVTDLNDSLKFYFLVDFLAKSYHISIILFNMLVVFKASKLGFTLYMTETVLLFVEVTNLYTQANDLSLNVSS
ncbi:unnamed protein product [Phaedon cochleariae]|uniref:Odorant receptor n=1 Tax=Phaedon cochleariae TaxID=80249 RepID=A0A9N9SBD6_PHACE|nr:unnamed protein product [Phaedon cochleariae]